MLNRLLLLIGILLVTIGCGRKKLDENIKTEERLNVLFILADDFGLYDLSFMGSDYYETPNIDRIAKEGTVFTQGYAASRVCSPSRASIMIGQFTGRHQITDWIGAKSGEDWRTLNRNDKLLPASYNHVIPADAITFPEAMQDAGYRTFFAGKWHIGDEGSSPENHGFEINKGGWKVGSPMGGYFSPWENPKLDNVKDGENLSMRLAAETASFIKDNKEHPFLAFLSFYAVHGPIQTTEEKWRKYQQKAVKTGIAENGFEMERVLPIRVTQDNPVYAGLVEQMDDAIGVAMKALEEAGIADKTIVIFTSDNGGVASGDAFSTSNTPLRGGKGYQWEGGIREPYFMKVPGVDVQEVNYPVSGVDFYPTLLELTGIGLPENSQKIDGQSLVPLLRGKAMEERPLYWHYPHYGNQGGEPSSIIRQGDWKLIHYYEDGRNELYHLESDPSEQTDLATTNETKTEKLSKQLHQWLKEVEANRAEMDHQFDPKLAEVNRQKKISELLPRLEKQRMEFLADDFNPGNDWWGSSLFDD